MFALPIDTDQIVITASRLPEKEADTPASVTIIDKQRIARLGEPLVPALLRLTPSAAVAFSSSTRRSTPEMAGPATDGVHGIGQLGGGLL